MSSNSVEAWSRGTLGFLGGKGYCVFQASSSASTWFGWDGLPGLDESDRRRALARQAHVWSPCMEKSMHAWAASMQMKNRAASLLHTSQPSYFVTLVSTGVVDHGNATGCAKTCTNRPVCAAAPILPTANILFSRVDARLAGLTPATTRILQAGWLAGW
jgi:hypothetical protein